MNSCLKGERGERSWRDELLAHGYQARRGGNELNRLKALGADHMALDFRVGPTEAVHHWTSELITAMGRWQMELVFSVIETEESNCPTRRRFKPR